MIMGTGITLDFATAVATDVGLRRQVNEDSVRVVAPNGSRGDLLAIIADGMGGHGYGDIASRRAVDAAVGAYDEGNPEHAAAIVAAVAEANRAVFELAEADPRLRGMGTTCTALSIRRDEAACAHVGDSRLYLLRDAALYQMTEDHSQVRALVTRGIISAEDARVHGERNVLLRALGTSPEVAIDGWAPFTLRAGDRLLLCTDGLHGSVTDAEMARALGGRTPADACGELIALALARGGEDNITAAIVLVQGVAS
jgi:serine/threonine protein phosphatase PrpC